MSRIIGIDLGTSTTEVAILTDGKPVVIPNTIGKQITPSAVHIGADGTITVGEEAAEKLLLEPESTFIEVKRLMGTNQKLSAHEKTYTPQQLSSYLLRYMTSVAEAYLKEEVTRAVITVPAYFSDAQRRATVEAGKLAGLTVERIINEPTAAALCYGIDHLADCANILIYDFGGGTLDVTVLELFEGVLEVRASSGNNRLGGKDFDEVIIRRILAAFPAQQQEYIKKDLRAMSRLKKEAEACKIALSNSDTYTVALPFFAQVAGKPVSVDLTISRKDFEALIRSDVTSTQEQIDSALADADLKISDIDAVLLVGGSTKIPYVEHFIADTIGQKPLHLVDPDLSVASGAAIQGGLLDEADAYDALVLTDVCPYTLGTAVLQRDYQNDPGHLAFDPLIPRNTTIPVTKEKLYVTAASRQSEVLIQAYQGEYSDPARNNHLGEFRLSGIPPAPAGKEKIKVDFSYDANGILQVAATIVSTGEDASITISTTDTDMEEEVDITKWKESKRAKRYAALIRRVERMLKAEEDDELRDLLRELKEGLVKEIGTDTLEEIKEDLVDYITEYDGDEE